MIYLDNAATSFPKPKNVISEVRKCIEEYCGNPGRSSHDLSLKISERIYETREKIADFIGLYTPENVVFTPNATYALNLAIKTEIKPDSHVIISNLEHNSVYRPIFALSERLGVEFSCFNAYGDISKEIPRLIKENTCCIVSTLQSNVTGRRISAKALSDLAQAHGLKLILDASQYIGHGELDLSNTPCTLCAPGHKALFGIQGSGFVAFSDPSERETLIEGGSGNDSKNPRMPERLPERFEAGTPSSQSIISMLYGIKFIENIGFRQIEEKINALTQKYADILFSLKRAVVHEYGNGIISFNVLGIPAETVAEALNRRKIYVRSGLHCAPLAHNAIGTGEIGTVRVSLSYLNSRREADTFYKAIRDISAIY